MFCGEELGEVVGVAGFLASEVGDMVLAQERLAIDGDERFDGEAAEVGFAVDLAVLPGFFEAFAVWKAVIVDFHGVIRFNVFYLVL